MRHCGFAFIGTVLFALLVTACAGVTTSQVSWGAATQAERNNFDQAMNYADKVKAKYREALGNQSQLTRLLGATLIPFGAAAGGLGAAGGSPLAVTALLAAGGADVAE